MTIAELQQEFLSSGGQRIAPEDFFILLASAIGKEKVFLFTHPEYALDTESESRARDLFSRRARHEPVASILGHKEFYGRDFSVTKDTLVPRPETEILVELALDELRCHTSDSIHQEEKPISLIDIGTGSGCIAVSVAATLVEKYPALFSRTQFFATDISLPALSVAKKNAEAHQVSAHIVFLHGDLLVPYLPYGEQARDMIIAANLPYLSRALYDNAPEDVRSFEPESALVSGQEGLDHYYRLLKSVESIYKQQRSVTLFLEISPEQSTLLQKYVISLFPDASTQIKKDLAGKERVLEICLHQA